MTAGYSKTPLVRKLGIKAGNTILPVKAPPHYFDLLGDLPPGVKVADNQTEEQIPFIHLFVKDLSDLGKFLPIAKSKLDKGGMLWVSWIKKSSQMETDISESDVRRFGLELGLVDVKICAVDEDWSGLKFMYRKKDR